MSFVSADKIISVAWVLDNPTTPTSVTFTVSCGTTAIPCNGWFSVALLPPGAKAHQAPGMDCWTVAVIPGQTPIAGNIQDGINSVPIAPTADTKQDLTLLSATYVNGVSTASFKRLLNTGDATQDLILTNSMQSFSYAYNTMSTNFAVSHSLTGNYLTWYYSANVFSQAATVQAKTGAPIDAGQFITYASLAVAGLLLLIRIGKKFKKWAMPKTGLGNTGGSTKQGGGVQTKEIKLEVKVDKLPPAAPTRTAPPPPTPVKKEDSCWEVHYTDDGYPYYWNSMTDESVWEKPAAMNKPKKLPIARQTMASVKRIGASMANTSSHTSGNNTWLKTANNAAPLGEKNLTHRLSSAATSYRSSERFTRPGSVNVGTADLKDSETSKIASLQQRFFGEEYTYLDVILFSIYLFINLLAWLLVGGATTSIITLNSRLGYIMGPNALFATLPATRNSILFVLFGLPFDRTILYHRWIGRYVIFLGTVHYLFSIKEWQLQMLNVSIQTFDANAVNNYNPYKYPFGWISWLALFIILLTSFAYLRRMHFNLFIFMHFAFIFFFIFGAFHSANFASYAYASLTFYGIDMLFRTFWSNIMLETQDFTVVDGDVTRVKVEKHRFTKMFSEFKVGQYVFVNFPAIDVMEWHPFTLSSAPSDNSFQIHIKALGDHTNRVLEYAKKYKSTSIRVDGPYGNYNLNYLRYSHVLLVSGGIGVTPAMAMVQEIYRVGGGNFTGADPLPPSALKSVHFVWVVKEASTASLFLQTLTDAKAAGNKSASKPKLFVSIYVTQKSDAGFGKLNSPFLKSGRPVWPEIMGEISTHEPAIAFACGPAKLVTDVSEVVFNHGNNNEMRFDFHHEVFDF